MPNDLAYDLTPEDRCPDPLPDAPAGEFEYCELQQVAYDLLWRAHHYRRKRRRRPHARSLRSSGGCSGLTAPGNGQRDRGPRWTTGAGDASHGRAPAAPSPARPDHDSC
jgi:hypothetical protein